MRLDSTVGLSSVACNGIHTTMCASIQFSKKHSIVSCAMFVVQRSRFALVQVCLDIQASSASTA